MPPPSAIEADAVVVAARDRRALRARLVNGHRFVACVPRGAQSEVATVSVGDRIRVRFSPCDLSKGWIMLESEVKK